MTLSTWEMETIKNEVAEVREFYRQRLDADLPPLQEEIRRLSQAVGEITERRRESERQQVLAQYNGGARGGERPVVPFGKYQGMDALDLACVRSVLAAQQREPGDADSRSLEAWQANLKAAMDSTTASRGDELVPTAEAATLWADVNLDTHVAALFPRVDMPTNPFQLPLQLGNESFLGVLVPGHRKHRHHRYGFGHGPADPYRVRAGGRSALVADSGRGCCDRHGRRGTQHAGSQRGGSD